MTTSSTITPEQVQGAKDRFDAAKVAKELHFAVLDRLFDAGETQLRSLLSQQIFLFDAAVEQRRKEFIDATDAYAQQETA